MVEAELEAERTLLAGVFAECLNEVTVQHRVVVALDTVERLQYDLDEVQRLCELRDETTTVLPWLLEQLPRWNNCVVILAGRSDSRLEKTLKDRLAEVPNVCYVHKRLGRFDEDEAEAYFKVVEAQFPVVSILDAKFRRQLWRVTEGRPIRLELALEVVQNGLGFDRLQRELGTLAEEDAQKLIDQVLIKNVMSDEPDMSVRQLLHFLAAARKGLDAAALHYLAADWGLDRCQRQFDDIAQRAFIKRRPDDGRVFLHDEMYDLCDERTDIDVPMLSARLAGWYDDQIAEVDGQLATLGATRDAEGRRKELQERRKALQVDSLLYRLRADPRLGYQWYVRQAEEAIRAIEVGLDMRLRNELLAFLQSTSPVDKRILSPNSQLRKEIACGFAPQWVKRYLVRGQCEEAVAVAEKVFAAPTPCPPDDPAYRLNAG